MSFIIACFYDRFMANAEDACLRGWRQELLKRVHGDVLEIGAGTGANANYYPAEVTRLVLTEPDRHMRKVLERNIAKKQSGNVQVSGGTAEQILFANETFDCVVASLVCCSVNSLAGTLEEVKRVLKPGGQFVFLEHVAAAEGTSRRRWQNWINPVWRPVMGNCHLNRETEKAIVAAGFTIREITRESMRKALPLVRPTIRGIAEKS